MSHSAADAPPPPAPPRADPMSLSSIMSGNDDPPPRPPLSAHSRRMSKPSPTHPPAVKDEHVTPPTQQQPLHHLVHTESSMHAMAMTNGRGGNAATQRELPAPRPSHVIRYPDAEIQAEVARIEMSMDTSRQVNGERAEAQNRVDFHSRGLKRVLNVDQSEMARRKRRRGAHIKRYEDLFANVYAHARDVFTATNTTDAWKLVQDAEIREEKERKKDMQRKRRREKTLANESAKRAEAIERANAAMDAEERERLIREAQKHEKKLRQTTVLLQGGTPSKDIREVTPFGPNLEGGTMSSFQMDDAVTATPVKHDARKGTKGGKASGNRPRKTKEQKQAEKDSAAAAQAAIERGEDPPLIAPKEMERLNRLSELKRSRSFSEDSNATVPMTTQQQHVPSVEPYSSRMYNQLYDQIWRDLAKKDVGKVFRIKVVSSETRGSNLRKTAQLAGKEARRWQLRTNKSQKDVQARAKRSMREMIGFWKRNERDERDQRKVAERAEIENARKQEADREANRAARKLNFLITQTELYSHFVGSKVGTEEAETMSGDPEKAQTWGVSKAKAIAMANEGGVGDKVTNFEDLDFDDADETALHRAAVANAQSAVKEAQDRARAFNNVEGEGSDDDGEMNFQNPTSLQTMDVAQPKMLSCQLKEYQVKGLNWLVNLYEQGINGILADEMGLGKTVQSISVMAYLAETHGIWGPFLVIAPASTLHNWVQEIAKFVPDMKVLPYWGTAKERKTLRKSWDRRHTTYKKSAEFHVMVTSYQLVVVDTPYFQKMTWQYMVLDEAQAIKSSSSSRWKSLLGFHCRNRLLLTGTPIQNNMQELWALLHFIMPSLFDSHDEFSDWFSKDIESHAQSNTKLNEDQLKRLHMILKPFMLRRIKKHVQKELGDKIEEDVFCDLTYRQRAYYSNLRNKISILDIIEKAAIGDDQDQATLMNLVMQFRKVCNHPDLFERADTTSPYSFSSFAETASFMREGNSVQVHYSVRNPIEYRLPRLLASEGRLDVAGESNDGAGWRGRYLGHLMNIWRPSWIWECKGEADSAFSWLRFSDVSIADMKRAGTSDIATRAVHLSRSARELGRFQVYDDGAQHPTHALFNVVAANDRRPLAEITTESRMHHLLNVSRTSYDSSGLGVIEPCARRAASAPPIDFYASCTSAMKQKQDAFFNVPFRQALFQISEKTEELLLERRIPPGSWPVTGLMPKPDSQRKRFTNISVPSMRRFVTDSGKLATLDRLLRRLKDGGHRVLLYFQMTRMIDLMEEYLTYRGYKFVRLDGSTKLEDRRDTVNDFQTRPEIFVFLLSTRAGGLGINLTSADTVIFYDSDWNPTIDSQAMDRAHRLGQTRQVTVYRLITRNTIEERIRKRAMQKEEVQRVVITGQASKAGEGEGAGAAKVVEFGRQREREKESRKMDIAMWLADDEQAEEIERRAAEAQAADAGPAGKKGKKAAGKKADGVSLEDMYHEGEGHFDDASAKPSGAATPISNSLVEGGAGAAAGKGRKKGGPSKKAKTTKQRLAVADGEVGG